MCGKFTNFNLFMSYFSITEIQLSIYVALCVCVRACLSSGIPIERMEKQILLQLTKLAFHIFATSIFARWFLCLTQICFSVIVVGVVVVFFIHFNSNEGSVIEHFCMKDCVTFAVLCMQHANKMNGADEEKKSFPIARQPSGSTIVVCYAHVLIPRTPIFFCYTHIHTSTRTQTLM